MEFGEMFSRSWDELRNKSKVNSKIIFYFGFIPALLISICSVLYLSTDNLLFAFLLFAFLIVSIFTGVLASTSILYSTLFDKRDYSSSVSGGKQFYWRYFGLMMVQGIFLVLLFFALIIPAMIFGVYWALSEYILIKENKGVMDSLRGSFKLIRKHWWIVLGYSFLFGLIIGGISLVFSIPERWTMDAYPILSSIFGIFSSLAQFIILPLSLIFYKNLYLALKKGKK